MEAVDRLVQHTYNKIFFENLHFLKSDLEIIKRLILSNQKLLSNKLDKVLFISDLAEKLKSEKIDEALKQKREYGQVLMQDYKHIEDLYNWLESKANVQEKSKSKSAWIKDEQILEQLSNYLDEKGFIEISNDFQKIMIDSNYIKRVNWLKYKTTLIYLISKLQLNKFISDTISVNSFIENNFCQNGNPIKNTKQSKEQMNKPHGHKEIDLFINEHKNTLP